LEDQAARDKAVANAVALADSYLIRAKQLTSAEDLAKARTARDAARKAAGATPYTSLDSLDARIQNETARQNLLWWEFWGGLGIVGLAIAVSLGFYFWRRRRVLEMIHGPQPGQVFVLRQELTRVGALAGEVDWAIDDPYRKVSRHHCDVVRSRRHYFVVDCSTNGTFLNSRPLIKGEPVLLRRGDLLGLGSEVTLRFQ